MRFHAAASAAAVLTFAGAGAASAQMGPVGEVLIDRTRIEISGAGHIRTLPCNGRDVEITGSEHRIELTGVCRSLDVSGAGNRVTATLMPDGKLVVAGSDHEVRWRSTGEPRQDLSGAENRVQRLPR